MEMTQAEDSHYIWGWVEGSEFDINEVWVQRSGKPGSRGVGQIKIKCHANRELRPAPRFHRGS